jgi:hypothetical protein
MAMTIPVSWSTSSVGVNTTGITAYNACGKEPEYDRHWQRDDVSDSLCEVAKQKEVSDKAAC